MKKVVRINESDLVNLINEIITENKLIVKQKLKENYEPMDITDGINKVFEITPELNEIGSKKQYVEYIKTIFPNSKIKGIYYHMSPNKFEKFEQRNSFDKIWFSETPLKGAGFGNNMYIVILDIKRPLDGWAVDDYHKETREYDIPINPDWRNKTGELPQYKYDGTIEPGFHNSKSITVRKPEQIHILGSKEDINGFKKFVGN
jgi:hypothetical protein